MNWLTAIAIGLMALIIGMVLTALLGNTVVKGPNAKSEMNKYYRNDDGCYRYKVKVVPCPKR